LKSCDKLRTIQKNCDIAVQHIKRVENGGDISYRAKPTLFPKFDINLTEKRDCLTPSCECTPKLVKTNIILKTSSIPL
jgi:hypothetical protein